ncbi:MAG TPA: heavy-metal-associated domain-containing protein [Bacillales bacterium]|nr:heavy-metal-associated domain-containing protein [Bacillales bacterium]
MLRKIVIALALAIAVFGAYQMFNGDEVTNGKVTVAFKGIDTSCKQCKSEVSGALSKIIGIQASHINPAKDIVRVTFNSNIMKASWIANSLKAAGFKPEDIEVIQG